MAEQIVFVPVSHHLAVALRKGGDAEALMGHAVTPGLLRTHGYDSSTLEDAEFVALSYAGIGAVLDPGRTDDLRLVLAADVSAAALIGNPDDPYGTVTVQGLRWSQVRALFADEPAAAPVVAAARAAASGRNLESALTLAAVDTLSEEHDLLWFNPDELDQLPPETS